MSEKAKVPGDASEPRGQAGASLQHGWTPTAANRSAEERLGRVLMAVEQSPVAVVITDVTGVIEYVNPKFTDMTGYAAEEVLGQDVRLLRAGDLPASVFKELWDTLRAGGTWRGEFHNRKKNGELFWEEATISPVRDTQGTVTSFVALKEDITERKNMKVELRQSRELLNGMLDSITDAIWAKDPQGRFLLMNSASERFMGRPADTVLGRDDWALYSTTQAATLMETDQRVLHSRAITTFEETLISAGGEARSFLTTKGPILGADGALLGTFGIARDITERKGAESLVQERENLLRLFVEHSPAAIAMLDADLNYLVTSRRWLESYRLGESSVIGRNHYEVFPEIPERWREIHRRCLAGAVEACEEDPFPRADGTLDWVRWEIRPWHRADGGIGGLIVFSEVITERKQAEESLRHNQDMLARTEAIAHLGSWQWEVATDAVTWSDELFRILGRDPARGAPSFKDQGEIYLPADMARLRQAVERTLQDGLPYELELQALRPDGEARICLARGIPERGPDGRVTRLHGSLQDITKRKQAESALAESERHYRLLFEANPLAVSLNEAICDERGHPVDYRVLQVNAAVERLSGLKPGAMVGRTIRELLPDLEPAWIERYCRPALTGEPDHFERFNAVANRHFDISLYSPRPGQFVCLVQDISERKEAEAALRASEEKWRRLFEILPVGISLLNEQKQVAEFNPALPGVLETGAEALRAGFYATRKYIRTDGSPMPPEELPSRRAIQEQRAIRSAEVGIVKEDGATLWTEVNAAPLNVPGYSCVVATTNISDRKRSEGLLAASHAQLRSLLGRLQRAQEEERLKVSREIHDELGQLLTGLKMDVRWLERKLSEPGLPPALNPLLDRVVGTSELADALLATVQRIATELRPNALEHLGLEAALALEARRFQERSGLPCTVTPSGPVPDLALEAAKDLFYLCREALTNVGRHAQATRVDLGWTLEGGQLVIVVADDGIGMAEAGAVPSLGLAGMRERAARCGGTVQFEPNQPRGTRVTVRVPCAPLAADEGGEPC